MSLITAKKINLSKSLQPFVVGFDAVAGIFSGSQIFKTAIPENRVIWAFFFVIFLLLFIKNFRKLRLLKNLFKIDTVLSSSENNEIPVFYICESVGMSEKSMTRLLKKLIKKKYLHDCTLSTEGEPKIILSVHSEEGITERRLECPSCGHVFSVKAGAVARCPECASIINI